MQSYAELMAEAKYRRGKRTHLMNVWINPAWRFVRGYILRLGFLDGWRGLMFAIVETHYVHQKYLKLFLKQKGLPS
jgi:disulfide bond formation protein DsbB